MLTYILNKDEGDKKEMHSQSIKLLGFTTKK
jgi:hypothetical protein